MTSKTELNPNHDLEHFDGRVSKLLGGFLYLDPKFSDCHSRDGSFFRQSTTTTRHPGRVTSGWIKTWTMEKNTHAQSLIVTLFQTLDIEDDDLRDEILDKYAHPIKNFLNEDEIYICEMEAFNRHETWLHSGEKGEHGFENLLKHMRGDFR